MNGFLRQLVLIGVFLIVTVVMSWPVVWNANSRVAGEGGDPWQTMWRFEENWDSLTAGQSLMELARVEWLGGGEARLVNLSVWPWVWLQGLVGQPLAYNLAWLISCAMSGYAMYLLVNWLLRQQGFKTTISQRQMEIGALLAGLYYMLLPYRVAQSLGHFGAMQLQWMPLAVLGWLAWLQRPNWQRALGLGLVLGIQAWSEHHYALWIAIFMLITLLGRWRDLKQEISKKSTKIGVIVLGVMIIGLLFVPYWPTIRLARETGEALVLGSQQTTRFSADLLAFITPAPFNPLWGQLIQNVVTSRFTGNFAEGVQSLGLIALLFILFFHQKIPMVKKRIWLITGGVFTLIALGPTLHVFGVVTSIPLPYALVGWLPVFEAVRTVSRAGVMIGLSMAVLLGYVAATQIHRRGAAILLAVLIIFEFSFWPMKMEAWDTSGVYEAARNLPGSRIIELPAATNYVVASQALYESRKHGKEVVGSIALERGQDEAVLTEIRSLPALRQLLYLRTTHLGEQREDFFQQDLPETLRDVLVWLDVNGVVVHWDSLSMTQQETVRDFLESQGAEWTRSDYGDESLYEWHQEQAGVSDGIFIARDGQWQNVGFDPERKSVFAEIEKSAHLTIYNDGAERLVRLEFKIPAESHRQFKIRIDGQGEVAPVMQGETVTLDVEVPGQDRIDIEFENVSDEKWIIQDPKYIVVCSNESLGC